MAVTLDDRGLRIPRLNYMQLEFGTPDGKVVGLNKNAFYEMPFYLMPNLQGQSPQNSVSMAAQQSSAPVILSVSGEGPMQISHLACERTGPCKVSLQIEDGTRSRKLMKAAMHVDAIFGTGALPYRLPEALYIDELRHLVAVFTDISGAANAIRPTLRAAKYCQIQPDPNLKRIQERMKSGAYLSWPFWETVERGYIDLAAGASGSGTFEIGNEYNYELHQLSVHVIRTDTGATVTGESFSFDVIDQGRGESIINAPNGTHYQISNMLLFGTNNYPYRLHEPWTIYSGQRLVCNFTNLTANPLRIFPAFGGVALNNGLQGR